MSHCHPQSEVKQHLRRWLMSGVIEKLNRLYGSQAVLVRKKKMVASEYMQILEH